MFRRAALLCLVVLTASALTAPAALATFPGKDGLIIFEQDNKVVSIKPNGNGLKKLVKAGYNNAPTCSADGKLVVYSGQRADGDYDIFTIRTDGTHGKRLTHDATEDSGPSFSPDGKRIVFSRATPAKGLDLFVMNANGKHRRKLFSDEGTQRWARFSPNGKQIAFESDAAGFYAVWIMKANGKKAHAITPQDGTESGGPNWTPDGKRILFLNNPFDDTGRHLLSMKPNGKQVKEVPTTVEAIDTAVFSPSAKFLAITDGGPQYLHRQPVGGSAVKIAESASYGALDWCVKPKKQ